MKRTILLLSAALTVTISCEDFLDVKPQGQLTQEAFPKSASDALLATNAVYSTLRQWHYHSGGFPIFDIMSDDALKGSNPDDQVNTLGAYDKFMHDATSDGLDRWWATLYQGIRRANVVIENVPSITMDETLKNRYLAEARFLRGLYYFDLIRGFGGVPLVTESAPPLKVARATEAAVYALIEEDFDFAIANLPAKNQYDAADAGRATRDAAKAFRAKAALFQQDFVSAETLLLEVINSGLYDLEPVFANANSKTGEHGVESVFEIGAIEVEASIGNQYANTQGVRGTPNRGWGFNRPSINLQNAFNPADPRLDATVILLGEVLDGVTILGDGTTPDEVLDDQNNIIEIECYNEKVWIPGNNTNTQFGHNRRLIRFSDVLLMAAEVLNENDKPAQALVHLNRVRARAREGNNAILPDITETGKDALRDLILQERRLELALEGHRYWDLVRTGKAAQILGPLGYVQGKHNLLPIPQNEIDISQGTLTQNPNW